MKTIELFCGTKSFSNFMKKNNIETYTIDIETKFNPDYIYDLRKPINEHIWNKIKEADCVWMSPPCQTLSMASGNKHWTVNKEPKTRKAIDTLMMIENCKQIASYCLKNKKLFFIENPRARMRWFLPNNELRKEVWYCQYGDIRAKPTDIWTNAIWEGKKCKNGNKDHEYAPRGSKTGTQGLKNHIERGKIPEKLFEDIFKRR